MEVLRVTLTLSLYEVLLENRALKVNTSQCLCKEQNLKPHSLGQSSSLTKGQRTEESGIDLRNVLGK